MGFITRVVSAGFLFLLAQGMVLGAEVAITVDDLPRNGIAAPGLSRLAVAREMLAAMHKHALPPVYGFINARKLVANPEETEILREWVREGHPLGNHTYSHPNLNDLTLDEYLEDIRRNEPYLTDLSNGVDWKIFRYPYLREGDTREKRAGIRAFLAREGYRIAQVTIDFADYAWNGPYARCLEKGDADAIAWLKESYVTSAVNALKTSQSLAQQLFGRDIRHILLFHIGSLNAAALDDLLTRYEGEGVNFIDLHSALADEAYSLDPNVLITGGSDFLSQVARGRKIHWPNLPGPPIEKLKRICR